VAVCNVLIVYMRPRIAANFTANATDASRLTRSGSFWHGGLDTRIHRDRRSASDQED